MFELAGINCMNMYIPGETLENKKMRKFIISQGFYQSLVINSKGGILALLLA